VPPPFEYQNPTLQFEKFLVAARDHAGLATTNMAWNMVVGVLHVFRRRLTVEQVVRFAQVLPPVTRALFIEGWDPAPPPLPFADDEQLLREVRAVRHEHNFAPDHAIDAVAQALREQVDPAALAQVLATLPAAARRYWLGR